MSPTSFVEMCLTPRAAGLLYEAMCHSNAIGMLPFDRVARNDLSYALAVHSQQGEGDFYLPNDPAMQGMVSGIVWTAVQSGPAELRSSFRTLHDVLEKFGTVLGKTDAEKMTLRLEKETAGWRDRGSRRGELLALYENVYEPFADAIRENADIMKHDGVDHWVEVLVGNVDVIDAFGRHEQLEMKRESVFLGLYTALGMQHLHKSLVTIWEDIFSYDFDDIAYVLAVEGRDDAVDMISFGYSFCGYCMMSEYGDDIILALGRVADHVRRQNAFAVDYLMGMESDLASNPVAEYSRLQLLLQAVENGGTLSDGSNELLDDVRRKMVALKNQLLFKAATNPARPMSSEKLGTHT